MSKAFTPAEEDQISLYLDEFRDLGYILATWETDYAFLEAYIVANGERSHLHHDRLRLEAVGRLITELQKQEDTAKC